MNSEELHQEMCDSVIEVRIQGLIPVKWRASERTYKALVTYFNEHEIEEESNDGIIRVMGVPVKLDRRFTAQHLRLESICLTEHKLSLNE